MSSETYDFIIVGAGSAGCVLADKLTQCGRYKVLLLEAGGSDKRFWIKVPLGYGFTFSNPSINWCYYTDEDPGLDQRSIYWPRGKVLGGSSSINAMLYARGLPHDFDDWEKSGAKGWGWSEVEKTYGSIETRIYPNEQGELQQTGNGKATIDKQSGFLISASPGRPTSRGTISIVSKDPTQTPSIQPNSLATKEDCITAIKASRLIQQLTQAPTIKSAIKSTLSPNILDMDDTTLLKDFRARATTGYHPSCTCRMGHSPQDSVLDSRLRVHGIKGLRVIDASSFPNITTGNTNAPTLMLANRGADMVLADNQK